MTAKKFVVGKAPEDDIGKDRIRIHVGRRKGLARFTIARITCESKTEILCVLGSDGPQNEVQMNIDVRDAFGVRLGQSVELEWEPVRWWGQLCWYLAARDPAVRIPALVGAWSFVLGVVGIVLGLLGLVVSAAP
ncbi:hypothetical protein [Rhizobium mesoamericanum]|uniref:Transmembrane protein n=1 Tax=Rhizobium mesoamericanum STM3625 TaxID=1211777 RepID=K0Q4S8_9HYPH|nr:hypothetical protein [Rhizobium mesoamericanum]CCM78039.1 conserved hypothetical protein [Rhizobium mesoamericanum STM3625]